MRTPPSSGTFTKQSMMAPFSALCAGGKVCKRFGNVAAREGGRRSRPILAAVRTQRSHKSTRATSKVERDARGMLCLQAATRPSSTSRRNCSRQFDRRVSRCEAEAHYPLLCRSLGTDPYKHPRTDTSRPWLRYSHQWPCELSALTQLEPALSACWLRRKFLCSGQLWKILPRV